jgi:hypothetical protein
MRSEGQRIVNDIKGERDMCECCLVLPSVSFFPHEVNQVRGKVQRASAAQRHFAAGLGGGAREQRALAARSLHP